MQTNEEREMERANNIEQILLKNRLETIGFIEHKGYFMFYDNATNTYALLEPSERIDGVLHYERVNELKTLDAAIATLMEID